MIQDYKLCVESLSGQEGEKDEVQRENSKEICREGYPEADGNRIGAWFDAYC